ncbi:MAG: DUF5672 family protein [Luteimonas sp.]
MSDQRIDLGNVSLVCVETRRHALALHALEHCLQQARFKECLLLSPTAPTMPSGIQHVRIADINSVAAYSDFIVGKLGDYFSGEHVLIVQWDGFVLDATRWDARFLDYDYIGAPWPDAARTVGNGGFSLRSRRLWDALREINPVATHPEDACICIEQRQPLEVRGIRFAPSDLAGSFAWEAPEPAQPTFGFHGFFNFHRVMPEPALIDYLRMCDDGILFSVPARRLLKGCYRSGMHDAAREISRRRMRGPWSMKLDVIKLNFFARCRRLFRLPSSVDRLSPP